MGFRGRVYPINWPKDHAKYPGMCVVIYAPNVDTVNEMVDGRKDGETYTVWALRRITKLCEHVVEWSLETRDGKPLPVTAEAARRFDSGAIAEIIEAWADNGRVPDPSQDEDSENGKDREPVDPLGVTSDSGLPTGASTEVEALIPTQDVP